MTEDLASFEVLGATPSLELTDFSLLSEAQLPNADNASSISDGLSLEEAKQCILELLEDNTTLKKKLRCDNAVMRDQLSTVWAWHSQMTTSMAEQQMSLREARLRISELEAERQALTRAVEDNEAASDEAQAISTNSQFIDKGIQSEICEVEKEEEIAASLKLKEMSEEFVQLQEKYNALQSNYDRVSRLLQSQSQDQRAKEEEDAQRADSLSAQLLSSRLALEGEEERGRELAAELSRMREEAEEIPILKAQVEVYKMDLNGAVLAREQALDQLERVNGELRELQSSSPFCSNCGVVSVFEDSPTRGRNKKKVTRKLSPERILCPVCGFGFTDADAAVTHVNHCLDQSLAL